MLETPRKVTVYELDIAMSARMGSSEEYNEQWKEGPFPWSEKPEVIERAHHLARQGGNVMILTKEGGIVVEKVNIYQTRSGEMKAFTL